MTATIIDGKAFASTVREGIAARVAELSDATGKVPGLAVVLVGEDPASEVYVRNKGKQTLEAGMQSFSHQLPADTSQQALLDVVYELNANPEVHGILVQLPLPDHIEESAVINAIDPLKDVDGFHIMNSGKLATGQPALVPCTPLGCLILLQDALGDLSGKRAVVIGRSNIVGRPMAMLLEQANATVTVVHSRTKDPQAITREADIVVAAVGKPKLVGADWVKDGATIIDVGINRVEQADGKSRLVGDVDFDAVKDKVTAITPVPGGVGPMTIACLLKNTVTAFETIEGISS